MNKTIYKVLNSNGDSIGKRELYATLGNAKRAARTDKRSLKNGGQIVEYELVPISSTSIKAKLEEILDWDGEKVPRVRVKELIFEEISNKEVIEKQSEFISFKKE